MVKMVVVVKAGRGNRKYRVVKSCGPEDLVFQSLAKGVPMRDNNILVRHIKPAAKKIGLPVVANEGIDWKQPDQKPILTKVRATGEELGAGRHEREIEALWLKKKDLMHRIEELS